MNRRISLLLTVLLVSTGLSTTARASSRRDRALDARPFTVTPLSLAFVDRPDVLKTWTLSLFIEAHYIDSPVILPFSGALNSEDRTAIENIYGWDLGIAAGFPGNLELQVTFPVERVTLGTAYDYDTSWGFLANDAYNNLTYYYPNGGPGDPLTALKWGFFKCDVISAAIKGFIRLPFGAEELFLGDDLVRAGVSVQFSAKYRSIALYTDTAYMWRGDYELEDPSEDSTATLIKAGPEIHATAALAWSPRENLTVFAAGGVVIPMVKDGDAPRTLSMGFTYSPNKIYHLSLWAGSDLAGSERTGRGNAWHTFMRFSWQTYSAQKVRKIKDSDHDGIPDDLDECPNTSEDKDGFEDDDGCPEADNDGDGLPDAKDKCPLEPEDEDGYQDADGCPDPDNDHDGILDIMDRCPGSDKSLATKEDMDRFEDDDGCPDPDNDHDGIADVRDQCPNRSETFNGIDDTDGCPDIMVGVKVKDGKILPVDRIEFVKGTDRLTERSKRALLKIANYLKANTNLPQVRIEAHVAPSGSRQRDYMLSTLRAAAVQKFLIERGVQAYRLQAVGYGSKFPVASNRTRKGRRLNERVEFIIVFQ